jgi:signal transduction histidine kinase
VLQGCQNALRRLSPDLDANRTVAAELGLDLTLVQEYLQRRGVLRFLDGIHEAASRASRIVVDMLGFSRRPDAHLVPVRLEDLLETVMRLAVNDYDLKKKHDIRLVQVLREYDPELGPVFCDPTEIEQVFLNIVKNAAQAMSAAAGTEPPRITLRTRRDGDFARVEIEDNGPGMDEKVRQHVFEPFFTTKPAGIGTGLGLSVSHYLATERHGGTLSVESQPGAGAQFILRLPIAGQRRS